MIFDGFFNILALLLYKDLKLKFIELHRQSESVSIDDFSLFLSFLPNLHMVTTFVLLHTGTA